MHRTLTARLLRLGLTLVVWTLGWSGSASAQQSDVAVATRGPRFFFVPTTPKATPIPVDVHRNALLKKVVSLNFERPNIGQVLEAITRQTDLKFFYSRKVLDVNQSVSLRADSITVAAALMAILVDTGVDVVLSRGMQIALVKRDGPGRDRRGGTIVGQVTDSASGRGLSGAEVLLEHASWQTQTDTAGRYLLAGIDPGTYTMTVRRVGYVKRNQQVTVRDAQTDTVNISLATRAVKLDELVTTATGPQRRRDLGNSITTINADSVLQSAPLRSLTDLLENRVPGLTVQHTSGAPGDPARVRLRGLGSVQRGNDPVVIVDGVRFYAAQSEARSGNLTNLGKSCGTGASSCSPETPLPAPSPLDQIDLNIIDKIEVFKGPSAATMYGADAANGVIVVTTKRGRPGPTRWTASFIHGRTTRPGEWPVGYYRWGHSPQAGGNSQICALIDFTCTMDSLVQYQALNNPNLTILGEGQHNGISLTASGGNAALMYSVTGTYDDEVGLLTLPTYEAERFRLRFNREAPDWMRRPHGLQSWSVTSNFTAILGPTASVNLATTVGRTEQRRASLETKLSKLAGTYVDTLNGLYYPATAGIGLATSVTPNFLQDYYRRTTASQITFTAGVNADWRPSSWFSAASNAGINVIPRDDEQFLPTGLPTAADSGILIRGVGRSLVGTFNLQGRARKPLGWGFVFETSVGANVSTTRTDDLVSSAAKLVPGTSSVAGARLTTTAENRSNTSVFGWYIEPRVMGERISLSTGLRLDGGSNHGTRLTGSGGSLGSLLSLPKLNGSWVISEEPFFPFKGAFSSLRLRLGYGQAQVQPGAADRLRLYTGSTDQFLRLTSVGNTELRPERSVEFDGGFDADLLDNRVTVELTFYRKTQVDALMPVALPTSVNGGGSTIQNIGNIRNTGIDLTLGVTAVQHPALVWRSEIMYNRNTNVLVKLGQGVLPNKLEGLVEGYPVRGRWARPVLGYADQNDNGIIDRSEVQVGDSLVFMGRLLPDYTASLFTNLTLLGGMIGVSAGMSYESGAIQIDQTARTNWVLARALVDPSAPFDQQAVLVVSTGTPNLIPQFTEYGLMQEVSMLRFSSLSVNYRMPGAMARFLRAEEVRLAVQGSNLGLHSNYRGKDPDVNGWSPGEGIRDTGQLPQPRTWQLRVDVRY